MSDLNVIFGSRTALGLFTDSKNNSHELFMFRPSLGNKVRLKRGGEQAMVLRGTLFPIPLYCIYCSTVLLQSFAGYETWMVLLRYSVSNPSLLYLLFHST